MRPTGTTNKKYYEEFMLNNPFLFPWGPESDDEPSDSPDKERSPRTPPSGHRLGSIPKGLCNKVALGENGIHWMLAEDFQQAGKVLAHCQSGIERLRYATGSAVGNLQSWHYS